MQEAERLTDTQAILRAAFALGDVDIEDLWLRYIAYGGCADDFDVVLFLAGLSDLPRDEQFTLGLVLDELADDAGFDLGLADAVAS